VSAYYNEIDPYAAQWLRNLIAAGHIAPGEVDTRSITEVSADDLRGFTQCHFFAGIGVWSHALRLAGWDESRPVWTGSCPCQPFSAAGEGRGAADERHLWPVWFDLIRECRPGVVFGEQVEAAIKHGWLDLVQADLEGIGYAVGAVGLPAAGVGAPHQRARLWFVADDDKTGRILEPQARLHGEGQPRHDAAGCGKPSVVADAAASGRAGEGRCRSAQELGTAELRATGFWSSCDWLPCRDGKARPTQPGLFPLAHGSTARVGRLRAYGNAIVPQVAAEIIAAFMEARP
jgi:DNA (cytosine-5)-methyltransferase 1